MSEALRRYSVLVLFGKESKHSITSPPVFAAVTDLVARLLSLACPDLKARGSIRAGPKEKNLTPRQGPWSPQLRDRYVEAMKRGRFVNVELFDAAWGPERPPDAYGAVHKLWDYERGGKPTERTEFGGENCVTVALREDFVEGSLERLKGASKGLIATIDCLYGCIETGVPWDQEIGDGIFEDMIDLRWHNRGSNDHWMGSYRMNDAVARLYRGNLFSPGQLVTKDAVAIGRLPGVSAVESWPGELTYLELKKQPKYKVRPPAKFNEFIRFFDPSVDPND